MMTIGKKFAVFALTLVCVLITPLPAGAQYSYGHHPPGKGHHPIKPLPPAPPPLLTPKIRVINSIADVCKVCTKEAYNPNCYGPLGSSCLLALKTFRTHVLNITDSICDCYVSVANQLLQYCPSLNPQAAFLGNCDFTCNYGNRCPLTLTLLSTMGGKEIVKSVPNQRLPPPTIYGKASINFVVEVGMPPKICYNLSFGPNVGTPTSAYIKSGTKGTTGAVRVKTLFAGAKPSSTYVGCVDTPLSIIKLISTNPGQYFVQMGTRKYPLGALRGQLSSTPYLFSVLKQRKKPGYFGFVQLKFLPASVSYYLGTKESSLPDEVGLYHRVNGVSSPLFSIYGLNIAPPSHLNGLTPGSDVITTALTNPGSVSIIAKYTRNTNKPAVGYFSDTVKVKAVLTAGQEVDPPVGVKGIGLFHATIGAGAVCFDFKFSGVIGTITEAHIHRGLKTRRGPIQVILFGLGVPRAINRTCVPADLDTTAYVVTYIRDSYIQVYTEENPDGAVRGQLAYDI